MDGRFAFLAENFYFDTRFSTQVLLTLIFAVLAYASATMPRHYIPIFLFALLAAAFPAVTLLIFKLIRPTSPNVGAKLKPYECGVPPEGDARGRYSVRFYIVAILFVVFDVETIFLFPWAVKFGALGLYGLVSMFVFLGILIVGYVWLYKKGALEWV